MRLSLSPSQQVRAVDEAVRLRTEYQFGWKEALDTAELMTILRDAGYGVCLAEDYESHWRAA